MYIVAYIAYGVCFDVLLYVKSNKIRAALQKLDRIY